MPAKRFWTETLDLMKFATENGRDVVARIYQFQGRQYPVWEQILNARQRNVWLISEEDLRKKPNTTNSLPDLRAQGKGYYIWGFVYNQNQIGNGRSRVELERYLAQRRTRQEEWTVCDWDGNPVQQNSPSPTQNAPLKERQGADRSPRKSAAPTPQEAGNEKKNADPDLETSKKIILENFDKFKKAYKARYGKEFLESDDRTMFFRNDDDLKKILDSINSAKKRNQLIDPVNFYELCLGNPETADVFILGKNPGAAGLDTAKTKAEIQSLLDELEFRKKEKDRFFPLTSLPAMESRPWFPARLIFGHIRKKDGQEILPPECDLKEGILSQFITKREEACRYAARICSLDLVPYHTVNFSNGMKLVRMFGIDRILKTYVENAMKRNAIIICPYYGAVKYWLEVVEGLSEYKFFYTTHVALGGSNNPPQNGCMNINNLRLYSKTGVPRTPDENCDALFRQLVKLGWNGSILDCGIAEAAAVIVPPGAAAFRTEAKEFFKQITGRLPQKSVDPAQVKSGNGILRHILYVDTAEHRISGIEDMKKLVFRILETFAGLGVRNVAMNGIRCDDRPDMTIRPEEYQKRFTDQYLAENPGVFDTIALVDLRGGFGKHKAK